MDYQAYYSFTIAIIIVEYITNSAYYMAVSGISPIQRAAQRFEDY